MTRLQEIFEDLMRFFHHNSMIPFYATHLESHLSRFIINVPESEIATTDRICFQIEQAHWFYEDFSREMDPTLPGFTLKRFAGEMFQRCPLLQEFMVDQDVAAIYASFVAYKTHVPVCGCLILNERMDKILLVKGWSARASWTFPKGKINQNESDANCAIREVMEETGFDVSPYLNEHQYIEQVLRGEQRNRLFIVAGIPESTEFCPQTRKEISDIKWHQINTLPGYKHSNGKVNSQNSAALAGTKYFMVRSFMPDLQKWIGKNKKKSLSRKSTSSSIAIQQKQSDAKSPSQQPSMASTPDHASLLKSMLGISPSSQSIPSSSVRRPDQTSQSTTAASSPLEKPLQRTPSAASSSLDTQQPLGTPTPPTNSHKASLLSILRGHPPKASAAPLLDVASEKKMKDEDTRQESLLSILNGRVEKPQTMDSETKPTAQQLLSFSSTKRDSFPSNEEKKASTKELSAKQHDLLQLLNQKSVVPTTEMQRTQTAPPILSTKDELLQLLNGDHSNASPPHASSRTSSMMDVDEVPSGDKSSKHRQKNHRPSIDTDTPSSKHSRQNRSKNNEDKGGMDPHRGKGTGRSRHELTEKKKVGPVKAILQRPKTAEATRDPVLESVSSVTPSTTSPNTESPPLTDPNAMKIDHKSPMNDFKFNVGDIMKWFVRS